MSELNKSYWNDTGISLRVGSCRGGIGCGAGGKKNAVVTVAVLIRTRTLRRPRRVRSWWWRRSGSAGAGLWWPPAVSDALTQGWVNAGYSLVSRELVADCLRRGAATTDRRWW